MSMDLGSVEPGFLRTFRKGIYAEIPLVGSVRMIPQESPRNALSFAALIVEIYCRLAENGDFLYRDDGNAADSDRP